MSAVLAVGSDSLGACSGASPSARVSVGIGSQAEVASIVDIAPRQASVAVCDVACSATCTLVVASGGAIYVWGTPLCGEDGEGRGLTPPLAIGDAEECGGEGSSGASRDAGGGAGGADAAAKAPVAMLPHVIPPTRVRLPRGIRAARVACGEHHVVCIDTHGEAYSWGTQHAGELGIGSHDGGSSIGSGSPSGRCLCCTEKRMGVSKAYRPRRVAFNTSESTGRGSEGAAEDVAIVDIAAGLEHTVAVARDGSAWAWGSASHGQLGVGVAGRGVWACQPVQMTPSRSVAGDVVNFSACDAGWLHSALLTTTGVVMTTGWGLYGQLGNGATDNAHSPTVVEALLDVGGIQPDGGVGGVRAVACGAWHTAAVCAIGDLYTFGWGQRGELGHGRTAGVDEPTGGAEGSDSVTVASSASVVPLPQLVESLADEEVVAVSCGPQRTLVQTAAGDLLACGSQLLGPRCEQISLPTAMTFAPLPVVDGAAVPVVPARGRRSMACGSSHVCICLGSEEDVASADAGSN